jgi:DNA recombination protein RmuC
MIADEVIYLVLAHLMLMTLALLWWVFSTTRRNNQVLKALANSNRLQQGYGEEIPDLLKKLGEQSRVVNALGEQIKKFDRALRTPTFWIHEGRAFLGDLLRDLFPPDLVVENFKVGSGDHFVDFAVRLPSSDSGDAVHLPVLIAPVNLYEQFRATSEESNQTPWPGRHDFLDQISRFAVDAAAKVLQPGRTTEYFVLFMPYEGMFMESLLHPGFTSELRKSSGAMLAGPSTLGPVLLGFRIAHERVRLVANSDEYLRTFESIRRLSERSSHALRSASKRSAEVQHELEKALQDHRTVIEKIRQLDQISSAVTL